VSCSTALTGDSVQHGVTSESTEDSEAKEPLGQRGCRFSVPSKHETWVGYLTVETKHHRPGRYQLPYHHPHVF